MSEALVFDGKSEFYRITEDLTIVFKKDRFETVDNRIVETLSFLTSGMARFGQEELLFVLKFDENTKEMVVTEKTKKEENKEKNENEKEKEKEKTDVQEEIGMIEMKNAKVAQLFEFFVCVLNEAKKKNFTTEISFTRLGEKESEIKEKIPQKKFFDKFGGMLYYEVTSSSFPKDYTTFPNSVVKMMCCVLVTDAEMETYRLFGQARVLAAIGKQQKWFPTCFWNDLGRVKKIKPSNILSDNLQGDDKAGACFVNNDSPAFPLISNSVLVNGEGVKALLTTSTEGSGNTENEKSWMKLIVPKSSVERLSKAIIESEKKNKTVVFQCCLMDEKETDSHLVFDGKEENFEKISAISVSVNTNEKKERKRIGGSFVSIGVGEEGREQVVIVEDGMCVILSEKNYSDMMKSLQEGKGAKVELKNSFTKNKESFEIEISTEIKERKPQTVAMTEISLLSEEENYKKRKMDVQKLSTFVELLTGFVSPIIETNYKFSGKKDSTWQFAAIIRVNPDSLTITDNQIEVSISNKQFANIAKILHTNLITSKSFQAISFCDEKGPQCDFAFRYSVFE